MDDLVDDAQKRWRFLPRRLPGKLVFGRVGKQKLLKNVVFSPEKMVHYFDRDDDIGHAADEVEHEMHIAKMVDGSYGYWRFLALIEVSLETALMDSLIVAIPFQNRSGHTLEMIDTEYELKPPYCDTCKIFNHNDYQCPKKVKVRVAVLNQ
nr:zinc knuckle CX2CX4HX4C [Tanacetum cinerariifolium]